MKKNLLCSVGAACLLSACVKQNVALISAPLTVVSRIVSLDIPASIATAYPVQNTVTDFTYNGKLLSNVTSIHTFQDIHRDQIITDFSYDANGLLKSTAISLAVGYANHNFDITSSTVTYSGNHISSISFYQRDNTLANTFTLTYENGLLKQICDPNSAKITYCYDDNGNNIRELDEVYQNGQPTGEQYQLTNSSFDDKVNFASLIPLWVYFKCYTMAGKIVNNKFDVFTLGESLTYSPGKNNAVQSCRQGTFPFNTDYNNIIHPQVTYDYQYNTQDYPTSINNPGITNKTITYTTVQ